MPNYIVLTYAEDEDQLIWDSVAADSLEEAYKITDICRPYGVRFQHGMDPLTADELRTMADRLDDHTVADNPTDRI